MRIDQFITGEAVDQLTDAFLMVGFDGSILDANSTALDCYGYSRAEMLTLSIRDISALDSQDEIDEHLRAAAEANVRFETEHRRSDGSTFPVEVVASRVERDGEAALLGAVRDVSDRWRAEAALLRRDALLVGLTHATNDLLSSENLTDPNISDALRALGAAAPLKREHAAPVIRAGTIDTSIGVGSKTVDYTDEDAALVEAIASIVTDLSLKKKMQEELENFFELVPDMVCIISPDGLFHRLNRAWERTLGYEDAELVGRAFTEHVHPDDREETATLFEIQLTRSSAATRFTNRYLTKSGAYRWVEWSAAPMSHGFVFATKRVCEPSQRNW